MDAKFVEGMAEIFEVDQSTLDASYPLDADNWNSLAIVSTIALVDDLEGIVLNGQALFKCKTLGDVEALVRKAKGDS